jgi:hypothetical protein
LSAELLAPGMSPPAESSSGARIGALISAADTSAARQSLASASATARGRPAAEPPG